jgi:hypothetical protein
LARVKGFPTKTTKKDVTMSAGCYKIFSRFFAHNARKPAIITPYRRQCGIREIPAVSGYTLVYKMAKKQFFAILDTETTIENTVADLGIIICDREGRIYNQCAVLVAGHYNTFELFHDKKANDIWGYAGLEKRKANYIKMLDSGTRMLASVNAINRWINQAIGKYNPQLTAYNLAFDSAKCENTGIDLSGFNNRFCLWQAAVGNICHSRKYRQFALDNHAFNAATQNRNMTYQTNAEVVAGFLNNQIMDEPHTALEDARDFELPILVNILKKRDWREKIQAYNWRDFQVKDNFTAK